MQRSRSVLRRSALFGGPLPAPKPRLLLPRPASAVAVTTPFLPPPPALPRQYQPTRTPLVITNRHTTPNCAFAPTPPAAASDHKRLPSRAVPTLACRNAAHTHPPSTQLHPRANRRFRGATHPQRVCRGNILGARDAVAAGGGLGKERHTRQPLSRCLWATNVTNRCAQPLRESPGAELSNSCQHGRRCGHHERGGAWRGENSHYARTRNTLVLAPTTHAQGISNPTLHVTRLVYGLCASRRVQ
jgi:hypothetical protein